MSAPNNIRISHAYQVGLLGGLGVITALALGNALVSIASIITSIFTALFITLGLEPLIQLLQRRVVRRGYAISIVAFGLLGVLGLVVFLILPPLISQTGHFIQNLPTLLEEFSKLPWIQSLDNRFGGAISSALNTSGAYLVDSKNWPNLLGGVVQVGITLFNGVIATLTVGILTLYFMSSLNGIKAVGINLVAKSQRKRVEGIVDQVFASVGRYVMGQVIVASINASIVFTVLLIAGVKFAVVLAFIDFLLVLIPMIGSISGALIVIIVTAATMPPETTLGVAVAILIYTQIEAYLIAPRIMKKAVNVPAALIVVSALAGGSLLGLLGSLLAIPMAASLLLIVKEVWVPHQNQR
ncbi:MAG: AI-2E family transporter [Micrococcales bacterium]|jgi:predicted PurR-regulated permease PerM|nr:AI-2E family transporter [Actinomycetota bacterium]NCA07510.1 AI-2E family transporter [Micrococcales bacterium]